MQRKSAGRSIGLESDVIDVESERPDRDLQRSIAVSVEYVSISSRNVRNIRCNIDYLNDEVKN